MAIKAENINLKIAELLNLQNGDVLSYEEYYRDLRELIAKHAFGAEKFSQEFITFLANERKRIAKKPGVFLVKKEKVEKKTNIRKAIKFIRPGKEKSSITQFIQNNEQYQNKEKETSKEQFSTIKDSVESIYNTILEQQKLYQKIAEDNRKKTENEKRRKKEEGLEKGKPKILEESKKILTPFQSIFDKILRFLTFAILGRALKLFMDWASNPENKKKLESLGRFLKDWWPALLGTWFLFANPIGRFIRTIIGTVAKLTFKLAKFAIPKLLNFIATNPKAAIATAAIGTVLLANEVTGQRKAAPIQAERKAKVQRGDSLDIRGVDTPIDKSPSVGDLGPTTPFRMLQGANVGGIIKPLIEGVSSGGSIFSGTVDKDTGTTVTGAGPDTQFLPIAEGGGAVLQRGEVVLQKGARERMIEKVGVDPLAFNIGSNANKPRNIGANVLGSAYGGLIGLMNGGAIGIAAHHLKQDEALSSLTPGINDFTRPGSSNWSKITVNTPIHSYIDSVGQPTIGWGSTYYDSILNGKKPVKMGDKITKGKADNILSTNISGLYKEYANKIPHWNKMTDKQRAGLLIVGYNAPYGPIGAYKKLTQSLQNGDIQSAAQNLQRGGPNAARIALERQLLLSGPTNLRNLVGPKIVGPKMVGSGIPGIPPFLYNMQQSRTQKKQDGGMIISENTGIDIPGATADRQLLPLSGGGTVALQPGEGVVPRNVMNHIGEDGFNKFIASFDGSRTSRAAKIGYTKPRIDIPSPPSRSRGKIMPITLPPISQSSGGGSNDSSIKSNIPGFSAVSSASIDVRQNNADMYGIV